ncbi:helix-turn-helix domain-containing protein [Cellulomonas sp.]|uniref:winged helix-turn-helix domain-containing protein n=1 Tax=Cellulomonas sp. TaxID=40001 RepID=UPI001B097FEF|nr:helix-turn-helix domain-containing protein [Cellulomonas sp.]MBO9554833.1 helix-turn-helix transcriptional regulator [Cellulomonas sp.]
MADGKTPLFSEPPIGPEALKVFAHPLRTAMYNLLGEQGPSTATQLGRQLGESSGQTSYHLRQLEKHGFVEDDPDHTGGRERWWRAVGFSVDGREMLKNPATAPAARALLQSVVADRAEVLTRWMSRTEAAPGWDDSEINDRITTDLTPDEAHDLIAELQRVLTDHVEAAKALKKAGETAGRRTVRIYLDVLALPLPDDGDTADA